jgi:hypothetical protein
VVQGRASASLRFGDPRTAEVLTALSEGLSAEIHFQLRLYRRSQKRFLFLGDRLLAERRLSQTARYDLFEECFVIERQGRRMSRFRDSEAFLEAFCTLQGLPVGDLAGADPAGHYLLGRVRLYPVKILFPLSLITLFRPQLAVSSPWLQEDL